MAKPIRLWPALLLGGVLSLAGVGIVSFFVSFARGMADWGAPVALTDEPVRIRIQECGVELPESAHHLYHAIAGFVDHTEYMAFSTAPNDAMPTATTFVERVTNAPSFSVGSQSEYELINKGPGLWGPEWATPFWDISSVTNGRMFEADNLFVLVDIDESRVYISTWSQ